VQVIYAAPFILLSLIAFVFFLAVPSLRSYAFRALVAPVAFGFCSIVAAGLIILSAERLGLPLASSPRAGLRELLVGIAIYFIPGMIGSWIAVEVVRQIERRFVKTQRERNFAIRVIASLIIFCPAFIACLGVEFKVFPKAVEWWPLSLGLSFLAGALAAISAYLLLRFLQERTG
jgi:hypothetical protein